MYVCPQCYEPLTEGLEALRCTTCPATYPVTLGIPDFRPYPVGWLDDEERLLPVWRREYSRRTAEDLTAELVAIKPRPDAMKAYYLDASRGTARLAMLNRLARGGVIWHRSLDIGSGTGNVLLAMAHRKGEVYGLEPNLLHAIIAKKRAEEAGVAVTIACGVAEALPWPADWFTLVHAVHTLEHVPTQAEAVSEAHRVLRPGGLFAFDIPNRLSLWREPHTGKMLRGFLPRRWTILNDIRNRSLWGVQGLVGESFRQYRIETAFARFDGEPGWKARIGRALHWLEAPPVLRQIVRALQPGFEVLAWKG